MVKCGSRHELRLVGDESIARNLAQALVAQWDGDAAHDANHPARTYAYPAALRPRAAALLLYHRPDATPAAQTTVLDPFCGSGTSLVEAMRAGCRAVGTDASPLALFAATHHTCRLHEAEGAALRDATRRVIRDALERRRSATKRSSLWAHLHAAIQADGAADSALWFLLAASMQRIEYHEGDAASCLLATAESYAAVMAAAEIPQAVPAPMLMLQDARSLELPPECAAVDFVLTSPPYPGVYDYLSLAREERTRLAMVPSSRGGRRRKVRGVQSPSGPSGVDAPPEEAGGVAVGPMGLPVLPSGREWPLEWRSMNEMGARKARRRSPLDFSGTWQADQQAWLSRARVHLRLGGRAAIVIGDGDGIDAKESTCEAASKVGFDLVAGATISSSVLDLEERERGQRRTEHALLFEAV